jgi:HPt (histidine-containing phosphotransfer) domain-containing protein
MDDYVAKPVRAELLREAIARCGLVVATGTRATGAAAVPDDALHVAQIEMLRELPGLKHPALLHDVIEVFLEETPATLATLRTLAGRREQTATAKLAHRLAGDCSNLGGEPMRRAAHAVELAADLDNWAAMPGKLAALVEEWPRLRDALQKLSTPPFP